MAHKGTKYSNETTTTVTATTLSISTPQLSSSSSTSSSCKKTSPLSSFPTTEELSYPLLDSGTDLKEQRKSLLKTSSPRFRSFFASLPRLHAWHSISVLLNGSTNGSNPTSSTLLSNPISISVDLPPTHLTRTLTSFNANQLHLESARHRLAQTWLTFPFPRRSLHPSFWEWHSKEVWVEDLSLSLSSLASSFRSNVNVLPNIPEDSIMLLPSTSTLLQARSLNNGNENHSYIDFPVQSQRYPRSWSSMTFIKQPSQSPYRQRCSTSPLLTSHEVGSERSCEWRTRRCGTFGDQFKWSDSMTLEELLHMTSKDEEEQEDQKRKDPKNKKKMFKNLGSLSGTKIYSSVPTLSTTRKLSDQWDGWFRSVCRRTPKK